MESSGQIARLLSEAVGLDPDATGMTTLEREARGRMRQCGCEGLAAYVDRLRRDPEEFDRLVEAVVVPETWFFRDIEPFVFLEHHAREHWRPAPGGVLRVLSAPCATGEEPYSIAITLLEAGFAPGEFNILGVDVSRRSLDTARAAVYGKRSFRGAWPFSERERHVCAERGQFRVAEEVRALVEFERDNLAQPEFLSGRGPFDVIFCRNVLIYLTDAARRTTLATLDRLLAPGGVVVSGHSEMAMMVRAGYERAPHPRSFACRRAPAGRQEPRSALAPRSAAPARPRATPGKSLIERARTLADRGDIGEAERLCERALNHNCADADGHYLKGLIRASLGGLQEAEECLRKALYLRPDHYEALVQMSVICERNGQTERGQLFRARARRVSEAAERNA